MNEPMTPEALTQRAWSGPRQVPSAEGDTVNTTSIVTVIGEIDGSVERKTVKEKKLAEFRVRDIALKITAWEQRADQVPDSGRVVVTGYLHTRTYTYQQEERQTTEIRANNILTLDSAPEIDGDNPF